MAGTVRLEVRALAAAGLRFVSVALDEQANTGEGDRTISPENSEVSVLVIESREGLEIAARFAP